ncbi:MAG: anaerobic ribonucleoside triphosphate reductase [Firmicutes bacterium]|nr:anaerobic ribonucleoside triphosphate reductase [Bacillota bacterium]
MTSDLFPFNEIRKRDGRIVPFDAEKITQAIFKAAWAVDGEDYSLAGELTKEVIAYLSGQKLPGLIPSVEEIQDAVEKILIERGHARTAKAYILYRAKRTRFREAKSELMDVVKEILTEGSRKEEESTFSPTEKMHRIALAASQKYYLDNLLPPEIAGAHRRGSFHIHNLGYYSKTLDSLQIDLESVLKKEFASEKSPPKNLLAVLLRVALVVQRNRSDIFGEQALPFFDAVFGEVMRNFKSKPDYGELSTGLSEFLSCLESLSCCTGGNPLRSSIQLGLDTTEEGRNITKVLLENAGEFKWPKVIFLLKKGISLQKGDPNYDLYKIALKTGLRNGNPAFAFLDTSYNTPFDKDICFFSNGMKIVENRHGAPKGIKRGNIATLTLNLPRLALDSGEQELFFVELDRLLILGVRQLLHRYEVLTSLKCKDLPFLMGGRLYLGSEKLSLGDSIKNSLKNGLITIGFAGLPEAVRVLSGKRQQNGETEPGYELAIKIVEHISKRVLSFAGEYDLNIELCGALNNKKLQEFVIKDRQEYGFVKGVTDKDLYSPSFVLFQEDEGLEKKIALEGEIQKFCSAGYASKVILLPGMEAEGAEEIFQRLFEAGIGYLNVAPLGAAK